MMKRAMLGAALAAVVLVPSVSHAQRRAAASSPVKFALDANLSMPMSDYGDVVGTGVGISGSASKNITGSPVFLRGELGFTYNTGKDQGGGLTTKGNQLGGAFDLGYSFPSSSTVKPYAIGGLNIVRTSVTAEMTGAGSQSDNSGAKFGFNGGLGMRFKMGGRVAHIEGRYMNQGTWDGASIASFPISFGVEF